MTSYLNIRVPRPKAKKNCIPHQRKTSQLHINTSGSVALFNYEETLKKKIIISKHLLKQKKVDVYF